MKQPGQTMPGIVHALLIAHQSLLRDNIKLEEELMEYKKLYLSKELTEKLQARKRPHQAFAGVIEELLTLAEKVEGKDHVLPMLGGKEPTA